MSLLPLLKKDYQSDQSRRVRSLQDKTTALLEMESSLEEREKEIRRRSAELDAREANLAARSRSQGEREGRALDDYVSETVEQGRRALLGDQQTNPYLDTAFDGLVPCGHPNYDAARAAAAIVQAGKVRRGEAVDERTKQRTNTADVDFDRITQTAAGSRNYDPKRVAAAIIQAGKLRRGEIEP